MIKCHINTGQVFWKHTWAISNTVVMLFSSVTKQKHPLISFLEKNNINDVLCLEMPAPSGSPALGINFIFTKAVCLKLSALAVESKAFPDPSGLSLYIVQGELLRCPLCLDCLTLLLSALFKLTLCCGIPASTVCWSPRGNCKWKHLVLLRTPNFFYWLQNKCCLNE